MGAVGRLRRIAVAPKTIIAGRATFGSCGLPHGSQFLGRRIAAIGVAGVQQSGGDLSVPILAFRLEDDVAVPFEAKPAQAIDDRVHGLLGRARLVRILDAEEEPPAIGTGEKVVEERSPRAPDMEKSRGRWGESRYDVWHESSLERRRMLSPVDRQSGRRPDGSAQVTAGNDVRAGGVAVPVPDLRSTGSRPGVVGRTSWLERARAITRDDWARVSSSGRVYLLAPACLAAGILVYFNLPHEPAALLTALVASGLGWFGRRYLVLRGAALLVAGIALPALHAAWLGPLPRTLPEGPRSMTGVIERIEGRESGERITLRILSGVKGADRVLLTARERTGAAVGSPVRVVAILNRAPGPVLPGHYDHARRLYFAGVEAMGVLIAGPFSAATGGITRLDRGRAFIAEIRAMIAGRIDGVLSGQAAAMATALLTGERGGLSTETLEAMRGSGLAHVLAISGMHMGLFCMSLFAVLRVSFSMASLAGRSLPAKKLAAIGALAGGTFYLAISGGQIATQRAYIMVAIACVAILLDRPALTLRNVATAALVVLATSPESLLGASFQMSFAATIALVAVYERWNGRARASEAALAVPGQKAATLFVTSLTAGLATTPYAVFHFHRLAAFSLSANLAAMPIVSILIMPAGLASLLAMPFGLETVPLIVMGGGIDGLLGVANAVSAWPGAMRAMPPLVPVALAVGSLGLYLSATLRGFAPLIGGVAILVIAALVQLNHAPPPIIIAENGKTFAVRQADDSLVTTGARFSAFTDARWTDAEAFKEDITAENRTPVFTTVCDRTQCVYRDERYAIHAAWDPASVMAACLTDAILITPLNRPADCPGPSMVVDPAMLGSGTLLLDPANSHHPIRTATPHDRPWRANGASRP